MHTPGMAAGAFSGLGLPQLLHCSRHWKLRLVQEGHTQSPAGRSGGKPNQVRLQPADR